MDHTTWMAIVAWCEALRWRWWLRARVTAHGAQVPRTRAGAPCPRCGDRMGSVHECRDLAR